MKRTMLVLGLFAAVSALGVSAQRQAERETDRVYTDTRSSTNRSDSADVNEIIRLQQGLIRGLEGRDAAALERIAADDFVYVSPRGETARRSRWLDDVESGAFNRALARATSLPEGERPLHTDDMGFQNRFQVRLHGDTAIAMGLTTATMRRGTPRWRFDQFATPVYARRGDRWRLVYLQLTPRGHPDDRDPFARAADRPSETTPEREGAEERRPERQDQE